jgi:hypothetical protein
MSSQFYTTALICYPLAGFKQGSSVSEADAMQLRHTAKAIQKYLWALAAVT